MSANVLLRAIGLNTQPNQLELPEGSLTEAENVVIRRDNVIESRRGYKLYGTSLGTGTDRAKQLTVYKQRILRHFASALEFDTGRLNPEGESIFEAFDGSYEEAREGLRIKFIEANSNLYFTTSDGIKKISARSAADFTDAPGFITQAGGIKAVDFSATLKVVLGNQTGWFNQDSAVAYRILWNTIDVNNNLIRGTPSQRELVFNPLIDLLLRDFARVLGALDDVSDNAAFPSLISDGDYVSTLLLPTTASATDLRTNLVVLASKIDNDLLYADDVAVAPLQISTATISSGVATVTFGTGDPTDYWTAGSKIFLTGFVPTTGTLDGAQVIASVNSTQITFNTTATGPVTTTGSTIHSNEFRDLVTPSVPTVPETDAQLVQMQDYLESIIILLQGMPDTGTPPTISADSQTQFIFPLDVTKTATVVLDITIPEGVTTNYFFQVYRSAQARATGPVNINDVLPNDELQLVYEAYPTSAEIAAGNVVFEDITTDEFRGENLYTNATTGEGILQANDIPPAALDINRFKNVIFYANTRTRHRFTLSLLGVANMIEDYNNGITPKILISNGTLNNTYSFVTGLSEITDIECVAASLLASSGTADYFTINSANDATEYYVWFKIGTAVDPNIAGKFGLMVELTGAETANQVAEHTSEVIARMIQDFSVSVLTDTITVENVNVGYTTDADPETSGFVITVTQDGRGENAALNQVLLSTSISPAQAVDETARSFVRVINKNMNEAVYAFYLSGTQDVPGQILLEERTLSVDPFYLVANNSNTGLSFNPDLSPEVQITAISVAPDAVITTASPHGLINQDQVLIVASNSTPSVDGLYTITYISPTTFSIPVTTTIAGTAGAIRKAANSPVSENEVRPNRIYFSKFLQPEAVPLVNFLDVGAKDKEILRIFPLRDSLFVFKEDGLFRISGESDPFNQALFDSSVIVVAPDSVDVTNNIIYGWTSQGIVGVTESGATNPPVSRPIDTEILKLATAQYENFPTATWGMGYESDNSYIVYTTAQIVDQYATIGYRYSTLTNSWTTFDKSATCGVINPVDGKQYLGAGDTNFLEIERKDFSRYDYADRELVVELTTGNYFGDNIRVANVEGIEPGDVIVQNQYVTVYNFNSLLKKLDIDPTLEHDYFDTLELVGGVNVRDQLDLLLAKIAADPVRTAQPSFTPGSDYLAYQAILTVGTITDISANNPTVITATAHGLQDNRLITLTGSDSMPDADGVWAVTVLNANEFTIPLAVTVPGTTGSFTVNNDDFRDVQASFNGMIDLLNNDIGVAYSNYSLIEDITVEEAIITEVVNINNLTKSIVMNLTLNYMIGPLIIFKAIRTHVVWAPQTLGDALGLKHMREATLIFQNKAFTTASMSFSTDLLPKFIPVPFPGDGNGIFGYSGNNKGFGSNFFGGASHSAPFRTFIPRDCQRCRYLNCDFTHAVAREQFAIYGLSLIGEISQSSRAYR